MRIDDRSNFLALWEDGSLCDIQLRAADGALVAAHRVVLAAASPFFRALFVGSGRQMREGASAGEPIDLPGVDEAGLRLLLRAVYANLAPGEVGAATAAPLLAAASYLSVPAVRDACVEFLQRSMALDTAVDTLILAERFDCAALRGDALRFLQAHLSQLLHAPDAADTLQALPRELLLELLASDELEVASEGDVAAAAAVWALGDVQGRLPHASALLSTVRACFNAQELADAASAAAEALDPRPPAADVAAVAAALAAAAPEARDNPAFPRRLGSPTALMVVGGVDDGWRGLRQAEVYDPRGDCWRPAAALLPAALSFAAAAPLGGCAYAVEGSAHQAAAFAYDRRKARWARLPAPPTPRVNMAAAALPAAGLFVLGGRVGAAGRAGVALPSVDLFDPERGAWRPAPPMTCPRAALAACALDGQRLFAIGGQDNRATHASAEWFDPGRGSWVGVAAPMAHPRKYLGAAAVGGRVVAVGGVTAARARLAAVEALDPREGRWRALPPLETPRSSCGVAVLGGELFVAGGSVGEGAAHDGMDCFSPAAGRWRRCAPMPAGRSGLALTPM